MIWDLPLDYSDNIKGVTTLYGWQWESRLMEEMLQELWNDAFIGGMERDYFFLHYPQW